MAIEQLIPNSDSIVFRTVAFETLAAFQRVNEHKYIRIEEERWHLQGLLKEASNAYRLAQFRLQWEVKKKLKQELNDASRVGHIAFPGIVVSSTEAATLEVNVADCARQKNEYDRKFKAADQQVAEVRDVITYISLLQSKYAFLRDNVQIFMETDDASLVSQCIEDFRQLTLAPGSLRLKLETLVPIFHEVSGPIDLSIIDQLASTSDVPTFCTVAYETLAAFKRTNQRDCDRLNHESDRLKRRLIATSDDHSLVSSRLEKEKQEKRDLDQKAASQAGQIASFEEDIRKEEAKINELEHKIVEDKKRMTHGFEDFMPILGIFNAIRTGDALRAIPYYSLIDGIVSVAGGDIKASESRISQANEAVSGYRHRLNDTRDTLEETQFTITMLETEAAFLQTRMDECDSDLKAIGQQLTEVQNLRCRLDQLQSKYGFLQDSVLITMVLDDASVMNQCIEEFRQLPQISFLLRPISMSTSIKELEAADQLPTTAYVASFCDVAIEIFTNTHAQDVNQLELECDSLRAKLTQAFDAHSLASSELRKTEEKIQNYESEAASEARQIDSCECSILQEEEDIREYEKISAHIEIWHSQKSIETIKQRLNGLRLQLSATNGAIPEMKLETSRLDVEATSCQHQMDKYDKSLKISEKLLAELRNVRAYLMQVRAELERNDTISMESEDFDGMSQSHEDSRNLISAAIEVEA